MITKIKSFALWTYVINDFNGEGIIGAFYEKELKKKLTKVIERKGDTLYVK